MTGYKEVGDILRTHLSAMPGRPPTIWENQERDPAKFPPPPFLLVQMLRDVPRRFTHRGGHILTGQLQISVVLKNNAFTSYAETFGDELSEYFPGGLRLGPVEIRYRPHVATGYDDGAYWRLPILIPWRVLD